MPDLHPGGEIKGAQLKRYWLTKGLPRWATHPHPWTTLVALLTRYTGNPRMAKGLATEIYFAHFGYYPGSDKARLAHGKAPKGKRVGRG